jgi:Xaa-Pro aminopeptidase
MFDPEIYIARRQKLVGEMIRRGQTEGCILLAASGESPRTYADNCYPFRQDSSWLYFIGLNEPGMLASIDLASGKTALFGEERSLDSEIWTGPRPALRELALRSGIEASHPLERASRECEAARRKRGKVHYLPASRLETARRVSSAVGSPPESFEYTTSPSLIESVIALREIKNDEEIAELEKAVLVTEAMHTAVLKSLRPGWTEKAAAALALRVASEMGCELGFSTIATTRGEVLHNQPGEAKCSGRDLFLLDAGAELPSGYSGDLTTTFPVGASFSTQAAELYALLLSVFEASTSLLRPGIPFLEVHKAACLELARGLRELGIMKGDPEQAVREGAHALFLPHGLGHMIGLDVHDMEGLGEDRVGYAETQRSTQFGLKNLRLAKTLKPGMVHSMEPGIYFIPALMEKWQNSGLHKEFINFGEAAKWAGCRGMRIEEDWLVLENGARRLGKGLDKSLLALESARASALGTS